MIPLIVAELLYNLNIFYEKITSIGIDRFFPVFYLDR